MRGQRVVTLLVSGGLTLLLAACGSQLDPETVRAASGGQVAQPGAIVDPGTGATVDPGTGAAPGDPAGGPVDPGTASDPGAGAGDPGTGAAPGTGGGGAAPAAGGKTKASCDGFKNQTGITDSKITIANSSDISGPVPGLFEAAQLATKAYAAYFNATSDICGRKLEVLSLDSRTDAAADQQSYTKACESAFAAVGSMSAFDSGGAATAERCGIPDVRAAAVTMERNACKTCFGTQSANTNEFENAVPDYFLKSNKAATQKAAYLYLNAGAAAQNGKTQIAAMKKRGVNFVYTDGIDVAEFNYAPYVQNMQNKGVRWVQFLGTYQSAVKLAQAMQTQGFKPDAYVLDPTAYDQRFLQSGGAAVDGAYIFVNFTPFEEAGGNAELQLYRQWLQQVAPGAQPTFFGLFAWSATRLFVEQSAALGGKLSRPALVSKIAGVDKWTGNGLHGPQHVGTKHVGDCWRFLRVQGGKFVATGGNKYLCTGVTKVG